MLTAERDELRTLQDRYLALARVRRFVEQCGEDAPLWTRGPTAADVRAILFKEHRYAFQVAVHEAGRDS